MSCYKAEQFRNNLSFMSASFTVVLTSRLFLATLVILSLFSVQLSNTPHFTYSEWPAATRQLHQISTNSHPLSKQSVNAEYPATVGNLFVLNRRSFEKKIKN